MKGVVVKFNAERGFGFVRIASWQDDVFVHISDIENRQILCVGQRVKFDLERTSKGPRAVHVRLAATPTSERGSVKAAIVAGAVLAAVALGGWWAAWRIGAIALASWFLMVNAATLGVWGWEKAAGLRRAINGSEWILIGLVLAGGGPAALLCPVLFRRKEPHKTPFRLTVGFIMALQVAAGLILASLRQ